MTYEEVRRDEQFIDDWYLSCPEDIINEFNLNVFNKALIAAVAYNLSGVGPKIELPVDGL